MVKYRLQIRAGEPSARGLSNACGRGASAPTTVRLPRDVHVHEEAYRAVGGGRRREVADFQPMSWRGDLGRLDGPGGDAPSEKDLEVRRGRRARPRGRRSCSPRLSRLRRHRVSISARGAHAAVADVQPMSWRGDLGRLDGPGGNAPVQRLHRPEPNLNAPATSGAADRARFDLPWQVVGVACISGSGWQGVE